MQLSMCHKHPILKAFRKHFPCIAFKSHNKNFNFKNVSGLCIFMNLKCVVWRVDWIVVPGAVFLEMWKRYSADITHRWDLTGFDTSEVSSTVLMIHLLQFSASFRQLWWSERSLFFSNVVSFLTGTSSSWIFGSFGEGKAPEAQLHYKGKVSLLHYVCKYVCNSLG